MAFTVTKLYQYSEGNKVCIAFDVTADANSGVISTGLNVVEAVIATPVSCVTVVPMPKFRRNLSAASATANGSIMVSSCTNGDAFTVIAIGH